MIGLLFYILMICMTSGLMIYVIVADKHNFQTYCARMFDVKTIQKENSWDRASSIMMSINCHFIFFLLAIIYWFRRIFKI